MQASIWDGAERPAYIYIHEDMVLPDNYSIIDAALNHQSVGGFCYLIEHLCMVLKVPLDEV